MIPEIRKLLCVEPNPFYKDLYDHDSVKNPENRPPVPGMGGVNVYFFTHNFPEAVNSDNSKYNLDEAEIVVGHFVHLYLNGVPAEKITVLTVSFTESLSQFALLTWYLVLQRPEKDNHSGVEEASGLEPSHLFQLLHRRQLPRRGKRCHPTFFGPQ